MDFIPPTPQWEPSVEKTFHIEPVIGLAAIAALSTNCVQWWVSKLNWNPDMFFIRVDSVKTEREIAGTAKILFQSIHMYIVLSQRLWCLPSAWVCESTQIYVEQTIFQSSYNGHFGLIDKLPSSRADAYRIAIGRQAISCSEPLNAGIPDFLLKSRILFGWVHVNSTTDIFGSC